MALPVSLDQLQPAAGAVSAPLPEAASAQPAAPGIVVPPEVLQQMANSPLIQSLQKGEPAAAYLQAGIVGGKAKLQEQYVKMSAALPSLGLAAYKSDKHGILVMYNPKAVSPDQIADADAKGTIGHFAIPVGGAKHGHLPMDAQGTMPVDPDAAAPGAITGGLTGVQPPAAPLPAGVADANAAARLQTLAPQPPVAQAAPAQGSIISALMKHAR